MKEAPLIVVVSIDTEEDNWAPTRDAVRVTNIHALPRLHRLLRGLGVRPTYFTNFAVASTPWACAILGEMAADGGTEIGAHLHPWNTPPTPEAFVPRHTMMKNLPFELQAQKLDTVTSAIERAFGRRPASFRAGRYGIARDGARLLAAHGYTIDSSVTPFLDWRNDDDGPDFRAAPLDAYPASSSDIIRPDAHATVMELPLSVGFTRIPFTRWAPVHERLVRTRIGHVSLNGVANRTRLLRKRQLSFESASVDDMLVIARNLARIGTRFIHVTWHSPSLVPGLSPFVRSTADRSALLGHIESFFERLCETTDLAFATVSEAVESLAPRVLAAPQHA